MPQEGLRTLASVYRWFKEGSATADVTEARELVARKAQTS
jgi:hypothetical protein